VHRLLEQYRMPAPVCHVVSKLFYRSLLTTPSAVARAKASEPAPLAWLRFTGAESVAVGSTSTINLGQIQLCCEAAVRDALFRSAQQPHFPG
jgi:superfamily I DNA and/or RNA helicase